MVHLEWCPLLCVCIHNGCCTGCNCSAASNTDEVLNMNPTDSCAPLHTVVVLYRQRRKGRGSFSSSCWPARRGFTTPPPRRPPPC